MRTLDSDSDEALFSAIRRISPPLSSAPQFIETIRALVHLMCLARGHPEHAQEVARSLYRQMTPGELDPTVSVQSLQRPNDVGWLRASAVHSALGTDVILIAQQPNSVLRTALLCASSQVCCRPPCWMASLVIRRLNSRESCV